MRLGNPTLAVDTSEESTGRWVEIPQDWWPASDKKAEVKLGGTGSIEYRRMRRELLKGIKDLDAITEDEQDDIQAELLASIVFDWRNIVAEDGEEVGHDHATVKSVLLNRDNRRFADWLSRTASAYSTFEVRPRVEAEIKN